MSNKEIKEDTPKLDQEPAINAEEQPTVVENTEGGNEVEKLTNELKEQNEKYLRLYSDFENFKRRTYKERSELLQTANQEMMLAVLPVLDDFERALKSFEFATDTNAMIEGIELIHSKFKNTLTQKGLKPIESIGQPFNLDLHEAITNIPVDDESKKDTVIDEVEKGYMLGEKVIRFAKVVIAS